MPISEYRCRDCNKVTELLIRSDKDQENLLCRYCGSKELSKILSKSNIVASPNMIGSEGSTTCCGRTERCDSPPCSDDGVCKR